MTIGERLKILREKNSLTPYALAKQANVSQSTIHYLEHGTRDGEALTIATSKRLAHALGVDLNYLCGFYEEVEHG